MDEDSRNERIDRIYEQHISEFKFIYGVFSKLTARVNCTTEDLDLEQTFTIYKEDLKLIISDFNLQPIAVSDSKKIIGNFGRSPFKPFKSASKGSADKF